MNHFHPIGVLLKQLLFYKITDRPQGEARVHVHNHGRKSGLFTK